MLCPEEAPRPDESRQLLPTVAIAGTPTTTTATTHSRTLSVPLLASLYFFSVSGGPIGSESIVSTLGPLVGLVCLAVYPFVYSLPISLTTAELSSAYSKSGGRTLVLSCVWTADCVCMRRALLPQWHCRLCNLPGTIRVLHDVVIWCLGK